MNFNPPYRVYVKDSEKAVDIAKRVAYPTNLGNINTRRGSKIHFINAMSVGDVVEHGKALLPQSFSLPTQMRAQRRVTFSDDA